MNATTNEQTVKGFINETHAVEIENVFGAEVAARVANAAAGETFLSILFAGFAN